MLGNYGDPWGGGLFLMSEVPLYVCNPTKAVPDQDLEKELCELDTLCTN